MPIVFNYMAAIPFKLVHAVSITSSLPEVQNKKIYVFKSISLHLLSDAS